MSGTDDTAIARPFGISPANDGHLRANGIPDAPQFMRDVHYT
jgi:hypothetical protein